MAAALGIESLSSFAIDPVFSEQRSSGECKIPYVSISAGQNHSIALQADGVVVVWGYSFGQPSVPTDNSGFVAVSAGGVHNLALRDDGSITAWWCEGFQMGQCNVPPPNSNFIAIDAGGSHSLGLKSDGSVRAWGRHNEGQINVPAPNSGFVAIAAGAHHSLALKEDGSIVAWGCGLNMNFGQCNVPPPNSNFVAIAAGSYHSLGLKSDGSLVLWGNNEYGQSELPDPNSGFVAVDGRREQSMGIKEDGILVIWGCTGVNATGYPCELPDDLGPVVEVSAGVYHNVALLPDGSIRAWGNNINGETNIPPQPILNCDDGLQCSSDLCNETASECVHAYESCDSNGDFDHDDDTDLADWVLIMDCLLGPAEDAGVDCASRDLYEDGSVDLADLGLFLSRVD